LHIRGDLQYFKMRDRKHAKHKKTSWRKALGYGCRISAAGQRRFPGGQRPPQTA
jgi:hypothetical protein